MEAFLDHPIVRAVLPNLECAGTYDAGDLRFYKGRFPCSLAGGYYGDRYVLVGDAATRLKQTLMFDLPIIDKSEVQALMKADVLGGGKRTSR